mgnify:CR=1 FL=1
MVKYICYNWMPTIAQHAMDASADFYNQAGAGTLHNHPPFDPYKVKDNDLIFVKTDYIVSGAFEKYALDKMYRRFNLITGVSSFNIGRDGTDSYKRILSHPNLKKWFCTNPPLNEEHSKIVPLPIGFEEPERFGGNQSMLDKVFKQRTKREQKKDKILLPYHDLSTNQDRRQLYDLLSKLDFVEVQNEKLPVDKYLNLLDEYKFVICLEGRGPDIHRNYESMLVGSIPINVNGVVNKIFNYHSIDGVFLNSWQELDEKIYKNILNKDYNIKKNDDFLLLKNHTQLVRRIISEN